MSGRYVLEKIILEDKGYIIEILDEYKNLTGTRYLKNNNMSAHGYVKDYLLKFEGVCEGQQVFLSIHFLKNIVMVISSSFKATKLLIFENRFNNSILDRWFEEKEDDIIY